MLLPRHGAAVSVLEFDRWLDGVVVEVSEASAEFLVDFDDEAEVQAWVSASQPWRSLAEEAEPPPPPQQQPAEEEQPALAAPPAEEEQPAFAAPPAPAPAPTPAAAPAEADDDESWERAVVVEQFSQLHRAMVQTDGHGAEPVAATRERFAQLVECVGSG